MTTPREPDTMISAWLEEGPTELPEATRRAITVATRTTTQHRRPVWASWRNQLMNPFSKVALVALALVAIVGGVYFLAPGSQVGTQSPASAPPSPAPQGPVPAAWTTYTSSRFAYTIDYPRDWVVTPATADWLIEGLHPEGNDLDKFGLTPRGTRVLVSSTQITDGMSSAHRIAQLDRINAPCDLSDRHGITLDGATARQEDFFCFGVDYGIEVVVANKSRHFQIDLFSPTPLGDTDRAIFDRFLASFRFADLAEYTSNRYGYVVTYPASLRVQPSQRDWPQEAVIEDTSPYLDVFRGRDDRFGEAPVFAGIASQLLSAGVTADDWMQGHAERNERAFGQTCGGVPGEWGTTTVDGANGRRIGLDCGGGPGSATEIVFTHGDRGWVISGDTVLVDDLLLTFRLPG